MKQPLLFLSHAGEDTAAARELARHLQRSEVPVWLDVERLRAGDRWMESLEEALHEATAFAVYVGRSGVARWVGQEVRVALDRSVAEEGFPVIPVLGPGADPEALPVFLRQHQWVDLRGGLDDVTGLRELAEVVMGEDRPGERVRRSLLPPDRAPFLGLRTFGEDDAFLFFGRDREVEELLELLGRDPFLAVVGASGSGKSSLVRAGLLPALRRGRPPGDEGSGAGAGPPLASWRIAVFRPADDPFRELAAALPDLAPDLAATDRIEVGSRISRELAEPGSGPAGIERAVAALVPAGTRTLLVADQLEEVFTQTGEPELRRRFLDALLAAGRPGGDRPVHVLATLRADFYSRCWEHPELPSRIAANQFPVERMARDQLREVIEKPLALAGVTPEPGLVDELLDDAGDEPGNLPLLEHALFQLWDQPAGRRFTHEAYREMGGLAGALEHHAEAVYGGLAPEDRDLVRRLFLRLAVVGEPGTVTRRRVPKDELLAAGGPGEEERARASALLDRWVERRLLTAMGAGSEAGEERVEVAHEALLRSWDRLRGWLEEDREFLLWRQGLAGAVDAWECADRGEGELLRGGPLRRAADWLERRRSDLTPSEADLIEASLAQERTERQRELAQARKLTAAVAGVALLLLLALAGTFWYYRLEERRGRILQARGLAAQVATVEENRPQLATLLALHALRIGENAGEPRLPEGETALRAALARLGGRVVGDPVETVLDGAVTEGVVLLATTDRGDEGGPLRLRRVPLPLPGDWEIAPGEAIQVMDEPASQVALAPSGRWLAANAESRPARLWQIGDRTGEPTPVALHDGDGRGYAVNTASLRFEGGEGAERLVVEGLDGQERTWALPAGATGDPLAPESVRPSGSGDEAGVAVDARCTEMLRDHLAAFEPVHWLFYVGSAPSREIESIGFTGHDGPVAGCSFGSDRQWLTWTPGEPARLWDLDAPPALTRGPEPRLALDTDTAPETWSGGRLTFAARAGWLGLITPAGEARVWPLNDGSAGGEGRRLRCGPVGPDAEVSGLALTADGNRIVLHESDSGRLCALDPLAEETDPLELGVADRPESVIAAGPEAAWLVLFDRVGGVYPVDPECPEEPEPLRRHLTGPVVTAVSPDGGWLASADPLGILYLTRVELGEPCDRFRPVYSWSDQPAGALALGAGHLAAGFGSGEIRLWALEGDYDDARLLVGHDDRVSRLAFGPDGTWFASSDESGRLHLWEVAGEDDPVRIELAEGIAALGFGGAELLVAHELQSPEPEGVARGQVYAFTLDLDRLKTLACRAAGRNLSRAEAGEFLGDEDPPAVCPGLPRKRD